ncbi:MAG: thioesterase family protein [Chitinophagaceae bacterium]|nr:thioesterase family protein [Chitinophagaceae bacterium]HQV07003.1 thioesterase family protein [Chitinophagaceae bacterium]
MPRIKIDVPEKFVFKCSIPVRINDINYGGHVGNDKMLSLVHEARMQFLQSLGYSELQFGGAALIMTDAALNFKSEVFYGDTISVSIAVTDISSVGFNLVYLLEKNTASEMKTVAIVQTGMVCYNYTAKKIEQIPGEALKKIS